MVEQNGEFLGSYIQMVHGLLSEYNSEIAEEVSKKLSFDVNALDPNGWYPWVDFLEYINLLSPEAQLAIGKLLMPMIIKTTSLFNDCSSPADVINKMTSLTANSYRNMLSAKYEIVESGDDFMKVKIVDTPYLEFSNLEEGGIRGIFRAFKIINEHVKVTKEENALLLDIKWE